MTFLKEKGNLHLRVIFNTVKEVEMKGADVFLT